MGRGSRVSQFETGQRVKFVTDLGHKVYRDDVDKAGNHVKVFDHNVHIERIEFGRISKLHKSGRQGVAEIFPDGGGKKVSRRLQHVDACAVN